MKIQNNSIYMGDDISSARHGGNGKNSKTQIMSIDASSLNDKFDPIIAKRDEAYRGRH